ncbi:MAG: hypothetical protein ACREU2_03270 [Steroidobacteraceae bacterium]
MLWLKGWQETRWRMAFVLFLSVFFLTIALGTLRNAPVAVRPRLIPTLLGGMGLFLSFVTAISLAGSGIQTVLTRPGRSEKSGDESTLFTLSLPVTRARLFAVRTIIGMLETIALLTLFAVVVWLFAPPGLVNIGGGLGIFAAMVACSLAAYAISACLSTFCDEGWRFRLSVLIVMVLFFLATGQGRGLAKSARLPSSIDIFRLVAAPLSTHQIPWVTVVAACVVAFLFLAAAVTIIQRRDY